MADSDQWNTWQFAITRQKVFHDRMFALFGLDKGFSTRSQVFNDLDGARLETLHVRVDEVSLQKKFLDQHLVNITIDFKELTKVLQRTRTQLEDIHVTGTDTKANTEKDDSDESVIFLSESKPAVVPKRRRRRPISKLKSALQQSSTSSPRPSSKRSKKESRSSRTIEGHGFMDTKTAPYSRELLEIKKAAAIAGLHRPPARTASKAAIRETRSRTYI